MAVTPSGAISFGAVNTALNRTATAPISIGDVQVRYLANQDSGSVNMNNMRNKQSTVGTITVGFYDDGKTQVYGFFGAYGSLSSNSFFGGTIYDLFTEGNTGGFETRIGGTAMGIPAVSARVRINGVSVSMSKWTSSYYTSGALTPPGQISPGMVGGTYSFQFAQT